MAVNQPDDAAVGESGLSGDGRASTNARDSRTVSGPATASSPRAGPNQTQDAAAPSTQSHKDLQTVRWPLLCPLGHAHGCIS